MTSLMRVSLVALLALTIGAGAAPSYAAADPHPVQSFVPGVDDEVTLARAWQRWEEKGIDDYVVTVRRSCYCLPEKPVRTVIRGDRTVRVTQGDRRLAAERGWSMDELFTVIRDAQGEADTVRVDYTRRGVPKAIAIDRSTMIADEEISYTVSLSRL
ncbi:DUF6174 domain-containing protein [Nocardioides hwasunensis]|uniref:Uncharacterized protein n=1 Tax=Nocardioides hwasunensis TaxID=397258 RepID=A0ABR8MEF8_9ACTN|nr:DUF6174 domain-containing protein [Nocardioides hwasunensis]MBD3913930.1 hypothetical protein [Nocardioides hwasunensis]